MVGADYDKQVFIDIHLLVNQSHVARDVDAPATFIFAMQEMVVQKRIELIHHKDIQPDIDLRLDLLRQSVESLFE